MLTFRFLSLLVLAACIGLFLPVDSAQARRGHAATDAELAPSKDRKAIQALRRQIAAEELAQALQLSESQAVEVVALIKEVQSHKAERRAQRQRSESQSRALFEDYLDEVQRTGVVSEQTLAGLKELRQMKRPQSADRRENRRELRERLRMILTEGQSNTLRSFRPMARLRSSEERRKESSYASPELSAKLGASDKAPVPGQKRARKKRQVKRAAHTLLSAEMLEVLTR